jgi:protein involved in polysaccharide export with SLBB domain
MRYRNHLLVLLLLAAAACSSTPPVLPVAQPGATVRSRTELQQLLRDHESSLASGQLSGEEQQRVMADVQSIRSRLEFGDFRVGDRILFSVQGETLPDTLTVAPGQVVELPLLGEIRVAGVLRSEIRDHLTREVGKFINDPVVRANALMRVSVLGAVGGPGFSTMPAETVLGEAIMVAGGPAGNANLEAVQIRRGTTIMMEDDAIFEAFRQGLTLDQLNMQAGDQIQVPERRGPLATLSIISGVVGSLSFLLWIFL